LSIAIILNTASGPERDGIEPDLLLSLFNSLGVEPRIYPVGSGDTISAVVRAALADAASVVVAAGGDGTVAAVAAELVGASTPLGVLPVGTLNHFARDAGIPLKLIDAARVIVQGTVTNVDVGKVNGRIFINNSSIGFYPLMVRRRESFVKLGIAKPLATVLAVFSALMRFPNLTVRVTAENSDLIARTPLVFVGNNEYELTGLQAGRRTRLQAGHMHVCIARTATRSALLRAALLALFGRSPAAPDLITQRTKRVRVQAFRKRVRVALDGELVLMRSPLDYAIQPGALAVLTPQDSE
jgi:diacylglycerol kinase family enzyme